MSLTGFADFNGGKIYYEVAGQGRPLVLIHGGLVNSGLWDKQFYVFAEQHRVIRYDVRGYGQSDAPTSPFSHHADVRALLDSLGVERATVLGLSMGGAIAIDFALAYPERTLALIPVAAAISGYRPPESIRSLWSPINEAYERGDKALALELSLQVWTDGPQRTPDQVDQAVREHIRAMTAHEFARPEIDEQLLQELDPPAYDRLGEIHAPTLVITGDADVPYINQLMDHAVATIPGAQHVVIHNAAHHLPLERPEEFNRAVLEFLKQVP
ncbi:MAG TPA: alpha/beta fold hydrolase [Anaerolineae bacterium]|nr:alpha/beta fold hydrolase [Anaerolineae bacterium]